jgi:hypothetical protein
MSACLGHYVRYMITSAGIVFLRVGDAMYWKYSKLCIIWYYAKKSHCLAIWSYFCCWPVEWCFKCGGRGEGHADCPTPHPPSKKLTDILYIIHVGTSSSGNCQVSIFVDKWSLPFLPIILTTSGSQFLYSSITNCDSCKKYHQTSIQVVKRYIIYKAGFEIYPVSVNH